MPTSGDLAKQQALRLLKVGIGAFVWDFWTWFFNGNCATYIQALPDWTNTWNAMPDLGFRRATSAPTLCLPNAPLSASFDEDLTSIAASRPAVIDDKCLATARARNTAESWAAHICAPYVQTKVYTVGCRAYAAGWWMDFELIYIGAGFITPLAVNVSMMIGAILSWGIAWPLLENREGEWYPAGLASHSFRGLFACAFT